VFSTKEFGFGGGGGFVVPRALIMKNSFFWDIPPCRKAVFLLALLFDPEDGADIFIRNMVVFHRTT
jgi:hypothetical protein